MQINIEDKECRRSIEDLIAHNFVGELNIAISQVGDELHFVAVDGDMLKLKLPVRLRQLQVVLHQLQAQKNTHLINIADDLLLDISSRSLIYKEINLALTEKETDLLAFLAAKNAPISRELLLSEVWGYQANIDTHTMETHLSRLRSKLSEAHIPLMIVADNGGLRFQYSLK